VINKKVTVTKVCLLSTKDCFWQGELITWLLLYIVWSYRTTGSMI
jgi:hypothetical protein